MHRMPLWTWTNDAGAEPPAPPTSDSRGKGRRFIGGSLYSLLLLMLDGALR